MGALRSRLAPARLFPARSASAVQIRPHRDVSRTRQRTYRLRRERRGQRALGQLSGFVCADARDRARGAGFSLKLAGLYYPRRNSSGGMAEWLKAHAWKACIRETVSWVRIPLPPPAIRWFSSLEENPFTDA